MPPQLSDEDQFEELLAHLRDTRGSDFTGYKRPSLHRLVDRRMQAAGVTGYRSYLDLLQVEPNEVFALLDALLINVTAFFRDPDAWARLRTLVEDAVTKLEPDEPIRVWSAACATGEEAYTLAMVLCEVLGDEAFRQRVKVYATDVDEAALNVARAGRYTEAALEPLTEQQRHTFFEPDGDRLRFRADLRPALIFGRHDLLQDAPISRVLVLTCRNALMYFTPDTQTRVLQRFTFALHDQGLLMLGKAEMLLTQSRLFGPVDLSQRIFQPRQGSTASRLTALAVGGYGRDVTKRRVTEAAFVGAPAAQIVLDAEGVVALLNERAQRHLPLSPADLGTAFNDLELSHRPVELRGHVAEVQASRQPVDLRDIVYPAGGLTWDLQISPLEVEGELLGVHLVFIDVTDRNEMQVRLEQQTAELSSAYEELQSSTEELETTNEELQSAVEELETTNEELQSTNEELETMNEELQSTNEELQTLNDELRDRTAEVDRTNIFLHGILAGLDSAVVVVDTAHQVQLWNPGAERLAGLRTFEVQDASLVDLKLGLEPAGVREALRQVTLHGEESSEVGAVVQDRFGNATRRRLTARALRGEDAVVGAVVTIVDDSDTLVDSTSDGGGAVDGAPPRDGAAEP